MTNSRYIKVKIVNLITELTFLSHTQNQVVMASHLNKQQLSKLMNSLYSEVISEGRLYQSPCIKIDATAKNGMGYGTSSTFAIWAGSLVTFNSIAKFTYKL